MFNFIKVELFPVKPFSASVSGVVYSGPNAANVDLKRPPTPKELPLPWRELQENPSVFSLLQWNISLSKFSGRDVEMAELHRWAVEGPSLSVRFITGEGGVGKTRLAAEFASIMRLEDWAAGFPDLRNLSAYEAGEQGTLLIIDYPEEYTTTISEMFKSLRQLEDAKRMRVLFLSRRDAVAWENIALYAKVDELFNWRSIHLDALPLDSAYTIMHSALENLAAVSDSLNRDGIAILKKAAPEIGIGTINSVMKALEPTSWWHDNRVERPQPDILAALFLVTVLGADQDRASEWLWAVRQT